MTLSEQVDKLRRMLKRAVSRINEMEKQMSDITSAEQGVEQAEGALEARVTAHEQNLKDVSAQLQAQIDALKAGQASTDQAAQALTALKAKIDNFDPDTAPAANAGGGAGSTAGTDTGNTAAPSTPA